MEYYYFLSYDEERDDFWAMVAKNSDNSDPVFEILSTADLLELLNAGVMQHLDDISGLEAYLKVEELIQANDKITEIVITH